jgi:hypothetical protein
MVQSPSVGYFQDAVQPVLHAHSCRCNYQEQSVDFIGHVVVVMDKLSTSALSLSNLEHDKRASLTTYIRSNCCGVRLGRSLSIS